MSKQIKATIMLLIGALIWGSTFVAQDVGIELVGVFTFQAVRMLMGSLVLLPVILLRDKAAFDKGQQQKSRAERLSLLKYGALCGVLLFFACTLQQAGLVYTTAGKSGFITALYIILVPITGLFFGKKVSISLAVSAVLAVVGLYFLCVNGGKFSLGRGELLTLACSVCFTVHILVIDRISQKVDGVRLSSLQFFFGGLLSLVCMLLTETFVLADVLRCWLPIVYAGVLSCGVAYTLQIVAQKDINPTIASITMSMESVFAVITGWLILNQRLSARELGGCILMFCGVILAQLPQKK